MLIVSNAMLMSNAIMIVRFIELFWLKPVAMVLFICVCEMVAFEALLCEVYIYIYIYISSFYSPFSDKVGILFVVYGNNVFSNVFERSEMGLYDVPMFMSLLGFGVGMVFANFHVCGMALLFRAIL